MSTQEPENKQRPYYVLYIPGGVLWGIMPLVMSRFLEDITQLPLSKQFNMFAGSSTGSIILGGLNLPKQTGSTEPKYSAADVLDFYKTIGPHIFPRRKAYYERQLVMDVFKLTHELLRETLDVFADKLDDAINFVINRAGARLHEMSGKKGVYKSGDWQIFRTVNKRLITPVNKRIGKGIDYLLAASRYDIGVLRRALDATFRHGDSKERVKLPETLISHHVTAMNVTRNDPAIFFHYKNPETGETEYVSDPDFDLDDLSTASSAAPTIFEVHQARNGDHYTDIAFFDTPQTCINSLHGQTKEKLNIRLVMLGTGKVDQEIDVKRLNSMLFLQQLIGRLGRHLLGLPQRFIMKRDLLSLKQSLGAENVIEIDYQVNHYDLHKKHANDPRVQRIAGHLGLNLNDRDHMAEIARLENHNLFDSSPEAISTLINTGWDMVWENLDTILPLARDLVRNSQGMGHISAEEADSRINLIEHFMAAADPAAEAVTPPSLNDFKISKSTCKQWLTFEEVRKRDLSEKFRYLARRAIGRESDFIPPPPHVIDASRKPKDKTPDDPGSRPK